MEIYEFGIPLGMKCDKCNQIGIWGEIDFEKYFKKLPIYCSNCNQKLNLLNVFKNTIDENFMLFDAFHCIGAKTNTFKIKLKADEMFNLSFSKHGKIPDEATILNVNYTPEGSLFPIEFHGNIPMQMKYHNNEIPLYPANLGKKSSKNNIVNVSVTWISKTGEIFDNLITAFQYYYSEEYEKIIIPANVAVEYPLGIYLTEKIKSNNIGNKRIKDFLQNGATYSHQLNVLLPLVINYSDTEYPMMNDDIRGILNRLRSYRNKMAHEGSLNDELTRAECAELLTAVLFAFLYLELLINEVETND